MDLKTDVTPYLASLPLKFIYGFMNPGLDKIGH